MAESPDVDFRTEYNEPFPEVQCPSTPGPQLSIKSPDLSTSSSSEETEVVRGDGNQSPPPNCAICLGRCKNKCFTDSCMHQFCFKCLLEWSKVKPECPLCKQTFKAIIHNVKSMDQFEEYLVQPPVPASPNPDVFPPFAIPAHLFPRLPSLYTGRVNLYMDDVAMNTLDLTGTSSTSSNANQDVHRAPAYNRRIQPAQLLDMYSQETMQGETGSGSLSQLWRRYVYDRRLYALPVRDITGRLRESSARFYRDNPSQVERLMPWINRDIVCLLRNTEHDVSAVMEQINGMLMTCNILSPDFRRRLQPFLGTKTVHFIHELNNFSRSPYDMIGYDRVVQYAATNPEEIIIGFSSSSSGGSDVESINDLQQEASTSSQASAINLSTHNRGAPTEPNDGPTTATVEVATAPVAERPTNIVLSSTSSDECEFVLEQKPPHLRTPEMVSLNSDSDSDVVFVQETKTTPMPSGMTKWASANSSRTRRAQRRRATTSGPSNQSVSSSNSDTDCDDAITSAKKLKLDVREGNAAANANTSSATATTSSGYNDTPNSQLTKVKEEFNQGASTSTGLRGRYRHYRRYTDSSDSDEIDDDEDSSSSGDCVWSELSDSTSDSDTSWSKSRRNSNKQSLKRSRQRKLSNASRRTRHQPSTSTKSKRSKRSSHGKNGSSKSSTSAKKKKSSKHSRRKAPKSKSSRRKHRSAIHKAEHTTSDEGRGREEEEEDDELDQAMESSWTCTLSPPESPVQHKSDDNEPQPDHAQHFRSMTTSPVSSTTTSDAHDAADNGPLTPSITPTTSSPSGTVNATSTSTSTSGSSPTHPIQSSTSTTADGSNPNANLAIYSDTD